MSRLTFNSFKYGKPLVVRYRADYIYLATTVTNVIC